MAGWPGRRTLPTAVHSVYVLLHPPLLLPQRDSSRCMSLQLCCHTLLTACKRSVDHCSPCPLATPAAAHCLPCPLIGHPCCWQVAASKAPPHCSHRPSSRLCSRATNSSTLDDKKNAATIRPPKASPAIWSSVHTGAASARTVPLVLRLHLNGLFCVLAALACNCLAMYCERLPLSSCPAEAPQRANTMRVHSSDTISSRCRSCLK